MEVITMAVTQFSGLNVRQSGNIYEVYLPQGIMVLSICMPTDGQIIKDSAVLDVICKVLAKRWRITKQSKNNSGNGKTMITISMNLQDKNQLHTIVNMIREHGINCEVAS